MAHWLIYETETGKAMCSNTSPADVRTEYEKGTAGRLSAILTADLIEDPNLVRVENGRVVPARAVDRIKHERDKAWFVFRQERNHKLAATDHIMIPDYPMSQTEREEINIKRKASRDIPQKTKNPELAMKNAQDDLG